MPKLRFEVGAGSLVGAHDGCDRRQSAERFATHLREALARDVPALSATITVQEDDRATHRMRIDDVDAATGRALMVQVEAVAHAVKHCADWVVHG